MAKERKQGEASCLGPITHSTGCIVSRVESLIGEEIYIGDKPFQLTNLSQADATPTIEIRRNLNWITITVLDKNVLKKSPRKFFQFNLYQDNGWEFFDFYHPQYQKNPAIVVQELGNLNILLQEFSPKANTAP